MKKDNKGFTLLEVLVAVIILAIIVVPMLRSFVTAYRVNARSREMMRATTLAQNEMEIFEKEKLEVLLDDTIYDYDVDDSVTYTSTDDATGETMEHIVYTFKREGTINDETGREMFDVVVTLDPESGSNLDLYYNQNTDALLFMNTLSGADSGAYVQRIANKVNLNGEDEEVYQQYVNWLLQEGISGSSFDMDYFAANLQRTITVKIEQVEQGGITTTVAKVNYRYRSNYGEVSEEHRTYSVGDKVIFNNSQTLDEEGNPIDLQSVYLFYAPRYDYANGSLIPGSASGEIQEDKIVIENMQDLPVNVYIIRQNIQKDLSNPDSILGVFKSSVGTMENTVPINYNVSIEINEGLNEDGKTFGNYFTNLKLGSTDVVEHGTTRFTLNDTDNPGWTYIGDDAMERAKFKSLSSTEAKDRIYTMKVAVYTHGADLAADDPLVVLTGTKIE